jgi:hypothetical protein
MAIRDEDLEPLATFGSSGGLNTEQLTRELDAVRERNELIEARLNQLQLALVAGRKEEALLEDFVALRRGDVTKGEQSGGGKAPSLSPTLKPQEAHLTSHPVVEATIEIFKGAGRPIHISELMVTLQRQQVSIPGAGDQANLISYLRRDDRIARPARGLYGLKEWGLEDIGDPKPKRKARRPAASRRKSPKRSGVGR